MATQKSYKTVGLSMPKHCVVVETSESIRHKVFVQSFARLVNAVKTVVVEVAVKAFSRHLISENNKCDAANRSVGEYQRANDLLQVIMSRIEASDAHFDAFVAILQELNITKLACELKKAVDPTIKLPVTASRPREDSDSGSASGAESVDATGFKCPCGQCSITSYLKDRSKCPGQQEGTFPHLDLDNLGKDEKEKLRQQLVRDTDSIMEEFDDFSDGVFEALERNQTPVEKIVNTIITSGQRVPRPIQDTPHGDELKTISTITGIHTFLVHHKYISFINYRILEKVIKKHCKECQADLDEYVEKFKMFGKRNVFEVPPNVINSSTSGPVLVVKVINEMWFGVQQGTQDNHLFSVNDVCAIRNKIAEVIETDILRLIDISEGCIQLAFEILSCQEAPIFPLTTSQLSELIRCGIIVLYQPNVPSLPINIQDTDGQTHDIQSTDADDGESPTIPSADDSETPPIPSADDSETPPISSLIKTLAVPSLNKPPVTRIFHSGSMASVNSGSIAQSRASSLGYSGSRASSLGYSGSRASSLGYSGSRASSLGYSGSRASSLGYSGSRASSLVELQEPGMDKKRHMDIGLLLRMEELERRIADKKSVIEGWKQVKAIDQQWQREIEEEVRRLKSILSQTSDPADQRELERKIQDEEETIKENEKMVQRYEEWINQAESALLSLYETKGKAIDDFKSEVSVRKDRVIPRSRSLLDSTLELPLRHGAKPSIEPRTPPSYQPVTAAVVMPTVPSSEQSQHQTLSGEKGLSLTMEELERRKAEKKRDIEFYKYDKADWQQEQRKAEKRVRDLQSRLAQTTDEDDQRELKWKIHDVEVEIKVWKEKVQQCEKSINKTESELLALTETKDKEQPQHQTLSGKIELSLMEPLEIRIADKKRDIEIYKKRKAVWQQEQRKSELDVRGLQSILAQTTDEDDQRELEREIHDAEMRIKIWKERLQQFKERINKTESELLALTKTKDKEQPQHQTLSGKKEVSLTMEPLEERIARAKSLIEFWKRMKAVCQQWQREIEERVRDLQSRLAQTTDEDDRRELERKIQDGEECIKSWKEGVQYWEERINKQESELLSLYKTKDKATESKRLFDPGMTMTSPSLQTDTSRLKSSQELPLRHWTEPSRRPMTPPSYQPVTAAAVKPTVPSSGHSEHQTSIELPPTLETKVDTVTLEDDA